MGVSPYPSNGATVGSPRVLLRLPERDFHESWVSAWIILLHCEYPDGILFVIDGNHFVKIIRLRVKGKSIPLQPWTGPGGFSKLRLPDFKTIGT